MLGRGGSGGMATATGPMGARATSDGQPDRPPASSTWASAAATCWPARPSRSPGRRVKAAFSRSGSRGAQSQFAGREGALSLGGGDAESGAGLDVGSGLVLADASTGLPVDLRVRMLVLHQAEGFRERDLAASPTGPGLRRTWATGCRWAAASWGR